MKNKDEQHKVSRMSLQQLRDRHASFDEFIEAENRKPIPDDLAIQRLKKLKLLYKDQIGKLTRTKSRKHTKRRRSAKIIKFGSRQPASAPRIEGGAVASG